MGEMIQNAEDAGATQMDIILDMNDYCNLLTRELQKNYPAKFSTLLGPSMTFINNKPMTEKDIKNIQSVGDSDKMNDTSSVGRFGHGFNSSFNVTDIPSLVTGDNFYFFDVHQNHFDRASYINSNRKGKKFAFNSGLVDPLMLQPYKAYSEFGLDLSMPFNQTMFRLPLRKVVDPKHSFSDWTMSNLKDEACHETLFKQFIDKEESCMIFLSNIKTINFYRMVDGNTTLVRSIKRKDQPEQKTIKMILKDLEQDPSRKPEEVIELRKFSIEPEGTTVQWLVGRQVGGPTASQFFKKSLDENNSGKQVKRLPLGGAAIPIGREDAHLVAGQVFSTLPTTIKTGLPVHIDGYLEMHSSRKYIEHSDGEPNPSNGAIWNAVLYDEIIAPMMVKLMIRARISYPGDKMIKLYDHVPDLSKCHKPFTRIVETYFQLAIYQPLCVKLHSTSWAKSTPSSLLCITENNIAQAELDIAKKLSKYGAEVLLVPKKMRPKIHGQDFNIFSVRELLNKVPVTTVEDALMLFDYLYPLFQINPDYLLDLNLLAMYGGTLTKFARAKKGTTIYYLYTEMAYTIYPEPTAYVHPEISLKLEELLEQHNNRAKTFNFQSVNEVTILYRHVLKKLNGRSHDYVMSKLNHLLQVFFVCDDGEVGLSNEDKAGLTKLEIIPVGTPDRFTLRPITDFHDHTNEELARFDILFPPDHENTRVEHLLEGYGS
ncbi:hypothetical protein SAMD00019534_080700 [Acytostelium subglobosum LB1]|uniref:hypothetical protein n=1 Tax=Acytostelium subglobosum LB1 TaxID=1410327 RepID=UPI000644CDF1|nr:hypothetical protein SAMD00019534_080700 [Acytostelium subglobosum LB1]GAM24895.1 hypothetical protein SAMD00019534_080700 [Acytostelium subglobosum LB1]|eukprot:XP_012751984.1 hypothetical protein SAMD00019534_080700 [Acytostelium subglobosum LB1]